MMRLISLSGCTSCWVTGEFLLVVILGVLNLPAIQSTVGES
ncbi:unnamed protein product [Linum tenue]|uniref:Uncharacterized protein n=1 Tax=Linum tenue TaxID=586396 RepID=A0AAV0MZ03_9ROSI|nr:unnamed protein product [Linum tenue]CAI0451509.1 unnamed protein product [Linum tenue]